MAAGDLVVTGSFSMLGRNVHCIALDVMSRYLRDEPRRYMYFNLRIAFQIIYCVTNVSSHNRKITRARKTYILKE